MQIVGDPSLTNSAKRLRRFRESICPRDLMGCDVWIKNSLGKNLTHDTEEMPRDVSQYDHNTVEIPLGVGYRN